MSRLEEELGNDWPLNMSVISQKVPLNAMVDLSLIIIDELLQEKTLNAKAIIIVPYITEDERRIATYEVNLVPYVQVGPKGVLRKGIKADSQLLKDISAVWDDAVTRQIEGYMAVLNNSESFKPQVTMGIVPEEYQTNPAYIAARVAEQYMKAYKQLYYTQIEKVMDTTAAKIMGERFPRRTFKRLKAILQEKSVTGYISNDNVAIDEVVKRQRLIGRHGVNAFFSEQTQP